MDTCVDSLLISFFQTQASSRRLTREVIMGWRRCTDIVKRAGGLANRCHVVKKALGAWNLETFSQVRESARYH